MDLMSWPDHSGTKQQICRTRCSHEQHAQEQHASHPQPDHCHNKDIHTQLVAFFFFFSGCLLQDFRSLEIGHQQLQCQHGQV